ncbi:MAG: uroporphyrinogen decarboxylase/cobalamine-independent methonine synthase family protein [Candidatus Helarchaeales archaeon]
MNLEPLSTTLVGSFPLSNTRENVERAFKFSIDVGLTYPCYPQLDDMILQFLRPLSREVPELIINEEKIVLTDEIHLPALPVGLEFAKIVQDYIIKNKLEGIKPKACLTGPFTMTSSIILEGECGKGLTSPIYHEPRAILHSGIVEEFARLIKRIAIEASRMGFNLISIDEPILGIMVGRKKPLHHDEDFIIKMLDIAFSGVKGIKSIHVCGNVPPKLIEMLLQSSCNVLDHEFVGSPSNFKRFEKRQLEQYDKFLALGSILTKVVKKSDRVSDHVETIEWIKHHVSKGIDLYGKDRLLVKPDCGFGALRDTFGEEMAFKITQRKIENMVKATNELK